MAYEVNISLPAMGEGITEAKIIRWLVNVGDVIEEDQPLVEIATDKVDSEVPSTTSGKVKELLFKEGDFPQVGQTICVITAEGKVSGTVEQSNTVTQTNTITQTISTLKIENSASNSSEIEIEDSSKLLNMHLSPLVRKIAQEENISTPELQKIRGTGLNDRITKDDILLFIQNRDKVVAKAFNPTVATKQSTEISTISEGMRHEVIPMDRMRKLIAEHMVNSIHTSAHVTSFIEVDVTKLVNWRNSVKENFQQTEGEKLTLTHLFAQATVNSIKKFPVLNSSVDGDNIIIKKNINLGIATALPNGNLIVPVIKNAEKLNLSGIASSTNDLAKRARENKLKPDEIQSGTFTISNLGSFDTLTGTPIINQPQVAILAIGAVKKRPVVIETPEGDTIGIRQMCIISLSYDHRVIDGALAGLFLKEFRDTIENFSPSA